MLTNNILRHSSGSNFWSEASHDGPDSKEQELEEMRANAAHAFEHLVQSEAQCALEHQSSHGIHEANVLEAVSKAIFREWEHMHKQVKKVVVKGLCRSYHIPLSEGEHGLLHQMHVHKPHATMKQHDSTPRPATSDDVASDYPHAYCIPRSVEPKLLKRLAPTRTEADAPGQFHAMQVQHKDALQSCICKALHQEQTSMLSKFEIKLQAVLNDVYTSLQSAACHAQPAEEEGQRFDDAAEQPVDPEPSNLSALGGSSGQIDSMTPALRSNQSAADRELEIAEEIKKDKLQPIKLQHSLTELKRVSVGPDCFFQRLGPLANWIDWLKELREPPRQGRLAVLVFSFRFELLSIIVILLNAGYTFYDTNYGMAHLSHERTGFMKIMEPLFLSFYTCELFLKLLVHRCYFFVNDDLKWNIFDMALVLLGFLEMILNYLLDGQSFVSINFVRLFRLVKLVKTLRVIRILHFFTELRLMLNCIMGSFMSLLWSILLLIGLTAVFAAVLVQQMTAFVIDNHGTMDKGVIDSILTEFGSVERATFTLFRGISGGDWTSYYKIVSATGVFNSILFILYIIFVWLSLANIITSVFVDKAMKLAQPQREQLLLNKHREDTENAIELKTLFAEMDLNESGTITWEEFEACMADLRFSSYFEIKGLDIHDAKMFFRMLLSITDRSDIDLDTFVYGCLKMRGFALNIDLLQLNYETKIMNRTQNKQFENVAWKLDCIHEDLHRISSQTLCAAGQCPSR